MPAAETIDHRFRRVSTAASSAVACLGIIVLVVGWWGGVDTVTRVHPSLVSMKANTALLLALIGASLLLLDHRPRLARLSAATVLVVGALTWLEYAVGVDLGIDELLARDSGDAFTSSPGRMGLNSAISFATFGGFLMLVRVPNDPAEAGLQQGAAIGVGAVGALLPTLAVFGYIAGVESTVGLGGTTQMAVHTSVGFLIAVAGAVDFATRSGPLRVLRSPFAGGQSIRSFGPAIAGLIMLSFVPLQLLFRNGKIDEQEIVIAFGCTAALFGMNVILLGAGRRLDRVDQQLAAERAAATAELAARVEERTRQLAESTAELQRSNEELTRFAHVASHDLREPIRMVTSFAQKLRGRLDDDLDSRSKQYLDYLEEGATWMETMVASLLDYSRAGSEVQKEPTDIDALVRSVRASLLAAIDDAQASVLIGDLPTLEVDASLFGQALQNLVANALKFRRPDVAPEILIHSEQIGTAAHLYVDDNGIGVPEEFRDDVFALFRRLHARDTYEGSGSGLTFTRRVVERHGGTVTLEASPTGGTRAHIVVPNGGTW